MDLHTEIKNKKELAHITDRSRLTICGTSQNQSHVNLMVTGDKKGYVKGLLQCGDKWICENCAAKAMSISAQEIRKAEQCCIDRGGSVKMLTLTVQHNYKDSLADVLSRLNNAKKNMSHSCAWKKIRTLLYGHISTLHITNGSNGWHPHIHMILLFKPEKTIPEEVEFQNIWEKVIHKIGLSINYSRAARLTDGRSAYYVCGINKKEATNPFNIINRYLRDRNERDKKLIQEYAQATKGRWMQSWSKGLKTLLELPLKMPKLSPGNLVAKLSERDWKTIKVTENIELLKRTAKDGECAVQELILKIYGNDLLPSAKGYADILALGDGDYDDHKRHILHKRETNRKRQQKYRNNKKNEKLVLEALAGNHIISAEMRLERIKELSKLRVKKCRDKKRAEKEIFLLTPASL